MARIRRDEVDLDLDLEDDGMYAGTEKNEMSNDFVRQDKMLAIGFLIGLVICKFVLHFGWIISIFVGLMLGGMLAYQDSKR